MSSKTRIMPAAQGPEPSLCNELHPMTVRHVSGQMTSDEGLAELADFYKLFTDKIRVSFCGL